MPNWDNKKPKVISAKNRLVVETFILHRCEFTATAEHLGYDSPTSIRGILARPEVAEYFDSRIADVKSAGMANAGDVIATLNRQMLADVADLFPDSELLQKARAAGISRNIKKVKIKKYKKAGTDVEEIELEMYNAQAAATQLGRFLGMESNNDLDRARTAIKMYCELKQCPPEVAIVALAPHVPAVVKVRDEFIRPALGPGHIEGEIVD